MQICFVTVLHRGVIARGLEEMPKEREKVLPLLVKEAKPGGSQQVKASEGRAGAPGGPRERFRCGFEVAKILRERSIFANTSQERSKERAAISSGVVSF